MKKSLVFSVLVAVVVGFASCGSTKEKSDEKDIISFKVQGVAYTRTPGTNNFTYTYKKTAANTWSPAVPNWKVAPEIQISENATIEPGADVPQDFEKAAVTYTVTAQDGSTATFTVKADRSTEIGK